MKPRKILLLSGILLLFGIGALFVLLPPRSQPPPPLPNPNGYDDFVAASQALTSWNGDLRAPPETLRTAVQQNATALQTLRQGLKKNCAVPLTNDVNWVQTHMAQISQFKLLAQLLIVEGLVHLENGQTNDAARSFTDGIVFAHAAFQRGFMIDHLVTFSCQALAAQRLVQLAPHLSPGTIAEILPRLIDLDRTREAAAVILQHDREWSRQSYGLWQTFWMRIAMRKNFRATEAKFEMNYARSVTNLRLAMTELAVRGHAAKNGKPPGGLEELVPSWLPMVPIDAFSARPLLYRVTTNGFLLYSVGPDGKDDQGAPLSRGEPKLGDLLPTTP